MLSTPDVCMGLKSCEIKRSILSGPTNTADNNFVCGHWASINTLAYWCAEVQDDRSFLQEQEFI